MIDKRLCTFPLSRYVQRRIGLKDDLAGSFISIPGTQPDILHTVNLMHERHVITNVHGIDAGLNYVH